MHGALQGIRVVDVTTSVAGPFATLILGDLGAEVIKVERPGVGDDTRYWGPPFWDGESCHFSTLNRNKKSVEIDLGSAEGRETLRRLINSADVLVQNLRPGALERRGLDYASFSESNPRLIYCEITGFGRTGPLADKPAYDPLVQAHSGLMSMVGAEDSPTARIPVSILDQGSGMWAVIGILDALRAREVSGRGRMVSVSLLGTALAWQPVQLANYFAAGVLPSRLGSGAIGICPYGAFPTATTEIVIAAGNQKLWLGLLDVVGAAELAKDPRFATNEGRVRHRHKLDEELAQQLRERTADEWITALEAAGVPCARINTLADIVGSDEVAAIGAIRSMHHPRISDYRAFTLPMSDETGPVESYRAAPLLGEHTEEILAELRTREGGNADGR